MIVIFKYLGNLKLAAHTSSFWHVFISRPHHREHHIKTHITSHLSTFSCCSLVVMLSFSLVSFPLLSFELNSKIYNILHETPTLKHKQDHTIPKLKLSFYLIASICVVITKETVKKVFNQTTFLCKAMFQLKH
jgi:hypothetical protein